MILVKDNKIVVCDEKDKDFFINSGYKFVSNKKTPAKKVDAKDNKTKDDEGKKLEGDLENL